MSGMKSVWRRKKPGNWEVNKEKEECWMRMG